MAFQSSQIEPIFQTSDDLGGMWSKGLSMKRTAVDLVFSVVAREGRHGSVQEAINMVPSPFFLRCKVLLFFEPPNFSDVIQIASAILTLGDLD